MSLVVKGDSYEVVGPVVKPFNVKVARVLVNEITKCGTTLYDILDTEPEFQVHFCKSYLAYSY